MWIGISQKRKYEWAIIIWKHHQPSSFVFLWLCWVVLAMWSPLRLWWPGGRPEAVGPRLLQTMNLGHASLSGCDALAPERRLSSGGALAWCSVLCGILQDQGGNLCLLRCQADSLPPSHHQNPQPLLLLIGKMKIKSIIKGHLADWAYHCWWECGALGISTQPLEGM